MLSGFCEKGEAVRVKYGEGKRGRMFAVWLLKFVFLLVEGGECRGVHIHSKKL